MLLISSEPSYRIHTKFATMRCRIVHLPEMSIFPDLCQVRAHTAPFFLLSLFFLNGGALTSCCACGLHSLSALRIRERYQPPPPFSRRFLDFHSKKTCIPVSYVRNDSPFLLSRRSDFRNSLKDRGVTIRAPHDLLTMLKKSLTAAGYATLWYRMTTEASLG